MLAKNATKEGLFVLVFSGHAKNNAEKNEELSEANALLPWGQKITNNNVAGAAQLHQTVLKARLFGCSL